MLKPKLTSAPGDDLKGAYVQKGDEWFLDALADDHPKMMENKTLIEEKRHAESELSTLKANVSNIERERDELKNKTLPSGHRAVPIEIADLGNAAKAANLAKDELPTLKTANEDLQKQIDSFNAEKTIDEVANANNFNDRFKRLAKEKSLQFEKTTEKVDGKDVDVWNVKGEADAKTKVSDFITTDPFFKDFADTFTADKSGDGKHYVGQESGSGGDTRPSVEREIAAQRASGRYAL